MTTDRLINTILKAMQGSSAYVLCQWGNHGPVEKKSPKDFVTRVDTESEGLFRRIVTSAHPDIAFLGEEGGRTGSGDYIVVLDPLDATTNFIQGIPLFDIAASLYFRDTLVFGAVSCPALEELFTAEKGSGAYRNQQRIRASECQHLEDAIVCWNRSNHTPEIMESSKKILGEILGRAATVRIFGTGPLDYSYLAKGAFHAVLSPLAEPYHSAGYIIMEESGAKVTDWDGRPHQLHSTTIAAACPELHPDLLELVRA